MLVLTVTMEPLPGVFPALNVPYTLETRASVFESFSDYTSSSAHSSLPAQVPVQPPMPSKNKRKRPSGAQTRKKRRERNLQLQQHNFVPLNNPSSQNYVTTKAEEPIPSSGLSAQQKNVEASSLVQRPILRGIHFGGLTPISTDERDPPLNTCFNCWKYGHIFTKCPLPRQHLYCTNCGRSGVAVNECQRCQDVYPAYKQRLFNPGGNIPGAPLQKDHFSRCGYPQESSRDRNEPSGDLRSVLNNRRTVISPKKNQGPHIVSTVSAMSLSARISSQNQQRHRDHEQQTVRDEVQDRASTVLNIFQNLQEFPSELRRQTLEWIISEKKKT